MKLGMYYQEFVLKLRPIYDLDEAENISDWVFEKILGLKRGERYLQNDQEVNAGVEREIGVILIRLLENEPLQYVLNESYFYKEKFYVDNSVLIPRPETEELVDWIIKENKDRKDLKILDVGCGSGCISISLKKYLPGNIVYGIDVSRATLKVAEKNSITLGAEVILQQLDFLNEDEWSKMKQFDIIVSNPPYIPLEDEITMRKNVTDYEPHLALFVEDEMPMIFYEKLGSFCKLHLKEPGKIYVETNEKYALEVKNIFVDNGLRNCEIKKDFFGKERMVYGSK